MIHIAATILVHAVSAEGLVGNTGAAAAPERGSTTFYFMSVGGSSGVLKKGGKHLKDLLRVKHLDFRYVTF